MNGSPVNPSGHRQTGTWLFTKHFAYKPQDPSQGSLHFSVRHAKSPGQSECITHSGLQNGGDPIYKAWHEHDAKPLMLRHSAYKPQGDGTQGFEGSEMLGKVSVKLNRN